MSKAIDNINKLANEKGVQYRSFEYQTRNDDENMYIEGRPVVFDTPTLLFNDGEYDIYEVIDRNAFDDADMSDVIFNVNHGGRVYARTRNKSLALDLNDEGLDMSTSLWADDPGHMELYRDISRGNIDKMSFAFTVKKTTWEEDEENKTATRHVMAIDRLFDVSAVDIPAYDATSIAARNSILTERQEVISERAKAESRRLADERAERIKAEILEIIGG